MRIILSTVMALLAGPAAACDFFEVLPRFSDPALLPENYEATITVCVADMDDLQIQDEYGTTPLLAAVQVEEPVAVAALLAAGADVEDGGTGYRPLHSAAISRMTQDIGRTNEIMRLLLDAGADVHADNGAALDSASSNGNTVGTILLLEAGADPMTVNDIGQTPFYAALNGDADLDEIIAAMIKFGGIDPNMPIEPYESYPLHMVLHDNKHSTITALIAQGADPNLLNNFNQHPLTGVSFGRPGDAKAVKALLDGGADPLMRLDEFSVVLNRMLSFDTSEAVLALRLAGFDFATVPGDIAVSLVRDPVAMGRPDAVEILLDAGLVVPTDHPDYLAMKPYLSPDLLALFE